MNNQHNNRYFKTDNSMLHMYYKDEGYETWYVTYTTGGRIEKMLFSSEQEAEARFNLMMIELMGIGTQI